MRRIAPLVLVIACGESESRGMPWTGTTVASTASSTDASTSDDDSSDAESDASTRSSDDTHGESDPSTSDADDSSTGVADCTVPPPNPAWLDEHLRE
ncbi:MAG TPA: hypothetical protein VG755_32235, partial [Nannocystaceae bacterium]|nr:hypothetical protein [Nannocystaceae bacterium]